jgi:soluble lytic murein transglycosylase
VARQESAFIEDVRSSAGAMGLMQLMPDTGRTIAHELNTELDHDALLEPETNIRFGSYYLQQVLNRFDNNPVMATAAYNAGPRHVEAWKPKQGKLDADIWIDTMPFYETRKYVRRVMAYTVFYDQRLQRPITRLRDRMPAVSTEQKVIGCDNCIAKQDGKG